MSISIYLHPKKYTDGTQPVMIRIIKDKPVYKTICKVLEKDWDIKNKRVKRSHSSYINLNALISDEFQKYEKRYFELMQKMHKFKASDVFEDEKLNDENLVLAFDRYLVQISQNIALSTLEKYRSFYFFLQENFKSEIVSEIGDAMVMKIIGKLKANGNNPNSIHRRISFFKSFVKWVNKEYGLRIEIDNPVKKHKSKKEKLTVEEIALLSDFDLSSFGKKIQMARDIFLMQYYLYGSRISDVLRLRIDDVKQDRINIVQHKTKAIVSIKMSQNIKDIIDKYKGQSLFYVFPELDRFIPEVTHKNIDSVVALINKNLRIIVKACGIEKHISTHAARHSFATNADKVVLDKRHISKALGHSTFKMTENYLSDLRDDEIDDSMSDVYK